jgi:proline iminopeptidase
MTAARAWCGWEDTLTTLEPQPASPALDDRQLIALARIETHFFMHGSFLEEGQLIANACRLHAIPGVIVQGRYDAVTPAVTAWDLHRAWPQAALQIVPDAGHASSEPGSLRRLIMATDAFAGT